jgi:polyribonucleotide nucleotidyltransferase
MGEENKNGWNEYSRLVISELERLNDGISKLDLEIQYVKREIAELKVKEDAIKDIKKWKESIDEVTSPTQLKETINDVARLKTFKTQAITVWIVVQVIIAITMAILKYT